MIYFHIADGRKATMGSPFSLIRIYNTTYYSFRIILIYFFYKQFNSLLLISDWLANIKTSGRYFACPLLMRVNGVTQREVSTWRVVNWFHSPFRWLLTSLLSFQTGRCNGCTDVMTIIKQTSVDIVVSIISNLFNIAKTNYGNLKPNFLLNWNVTFKIRLFSTLNM